MRVYEFYCYKCRVKLEKFGKVEKMDERDSKVTAHLLEFFKCPKCDNRMILDMYDKMES